jgi:hypothetical protein
MAEQQLDLARKSADARSSPGLPHLGRLPVRWYELWLFPIKPTIELLSASSLSSEVALVRLWLAAANRSLQNQSLTSQLLRVYSNGMVFQGLYQPGASMGVNNGRKAKSNLF